MLLSTSSFKQLSAVYWLIAAGTAVLIAGGLVSGAEHYWRAKGYLPGIIDSSQLWSISRQQAGASNTLAFLGASRTQFGVKIDTVRQLLPDAQPVMLAINGQYPLATLNSLAEDDSFTGVALVDVDGRGMALYNRWAQQAYNEYYHHRWTPNWHYHRRLLNHWQAHMAIGYPRLSAAQTIVRALEDKGLPFNPYTRLQANRSGYIDFSRIDPQRLADSFARGLQKDIDNNPPPSPAQWLAELAPVAEWAKTIEARGGKVIFYEPPVSGRQRSLADAAYPREDYWQRFIDHYQLTGLHYQDEPALLAFDLPDESHVSGDTRPAYTRALIDILQRRELL